MTRNDFIHRAALALLPYAYAENGRGFDVVFRAATSLAEDFAKRMETTAAFDKKDVVDAVYDAVASIERIADNVPLERAR